MYIASEKRYDTMPYNCLGASGLKLPAISLGLWHNFGDTGRFETMRELCFTAFDHGITHFDLANNYGPPAGTAEINFGRILKEDLGAYRDELIISTKAGYEMWPGPYGDWGSRKYLLSSLNQSLKRMGLDYVDIFYHHRMDPSTPLEETMGALASAVQSGKYCYCSILLFIFNKRLRTPSLLPLHRENVLCDLLLIGIGQFQKLASVFKSGVFLFDDTHNLGKHSRFCPFFQQPDFQ